MNVLLTVDGSSYSDISIEALKGLSIPLKSRITVITVVPEQTFLGGLRLDMFRNSDDAKKRAKRDQEKKAHAILQEAVKQLDQKNFAIDTLVRWGKPAEQITDTVAATDADLVVVGAKGASTSAIFPFGMTAQKVMKHANCSVLVSRKGSSRIDRILLATDGSKHAVHAAYFIENLRLSPDTSIVVGTALRSHFPLDIRESAQEFETEEDILGDLQTAEEEAGQELLEFTITQLQEKYSEVLPLVMRGDPTQEILEAAERFNPEMIVLGARGLGEHGEFKLGSVAQRVTKYAKCSVLIVRSNP